MRTRTKVLVGAGVAVVLVGGAAAWFGPGLYADWANRAAADVPTVAATGTAPGDPASLDGAWVVSDGSFAGYRVHEVLRGEDVTVTGRTEEVSGTVTVSGGAVTAARVEVDVASVATDEPPRDAYFRGTVMQVGTYPTATFEVTEPVALTAGESAATLPGELTIRGVGREVEVDAEVVMTAEGAQVVGSVPVEFADFGVEAPSLGFVRVDGTGAVEFSLELVRSDGD